MKLNAVGSARRANLKPAELSGGWGGGSPSRARSRSIRCWSCTTSPFAGLDPISLGVVGQLIRKMNDALGITSIVVTHDIYESLKIVDYLYFVSEGRIVAGGTPTRFVVRAMRSCASFSTARPTVRCRSTMPPARSWRISSRGR